MKENIEQMRKRHDNEIKELQKKCKHKRISDWIEYHWAIGHYSHDVKTCYDCGAVLEERKPDYTSLGFGVPLSTNLGEDYNGGGCLAKI